MVCHTRTQVRVSDPEAVPRNGDITEGTRVTPTRECGDDDVDAHKLVTRTATKPCSTWPA
jgi:hypothetical protein